MKEEKQLLNLTVITITGLFLSALTAFPLRIAAEVFFTVCEEVYYSNPLWVFRIRESVHSLYDSYPYFFVLRDGIAFSHLFLVLLLSPVLIHPQKIRWFISPLMVTAVILIPFLWIGLSYRIELLPMIIDGAVSFTVLLIFIKMNFLVKQLKSSI